MSKAKAVLKRLEYSGTYSYCTGWPCCPVCKGIKPGYGKDETGTPPDNSGHRDNCELVAALTPNAELGPTPQCPECNDAGERDSGGAHPWGEPIYLACDCNDAEVGRRWRTDSSLEAWFPITAEKLRELQEENARLRAALGPNANVTGLAPEQEKTK